MEQNSQLGAFAIWRKNLKNSIVAALLRNGLIHYYWFRSSDKKEFKKLADSSIPQAVECLVEGIGGAKNILSIKSGLHVLIIVFKSSYLLRKEKLEEAGGIGLKISDHELKVIFDWTETKGIVKGVKQEMSKSKVSLQVMDID